jgi:Outer membrane protein beta-barrel domain
MVRQKSFVLSAMMIVILSSATALAQASGDDEHKFEAGGHFSILSSAITDQITFTNVVCVTTPCPPITTTVSSSRENQPGFGGRIGYNLTPHVALEAEVNFFPEADSFSVPESFKGGHKIEGLFGVKAGKRFEKVGIFGKVRPGFLYASKGDLRQPSGFACIAVFPTPAACFETTGKNSFALDLGAVVEFYPTRRTIIRIDAGDTLVRFDERFVTGNPIVSPTALTLLPPFPVAGRTAAETTHNFQGSIGVGFRF